MPNALINSTATTLGSNPAITPNAAGDLLLLHVYTSGGGGDPYVSALSDTQGNNWNNSIKGTFGASSSYYTDAGSFYHSCFWAYAATTAANTVAPTFNGGDPGTRLFVLCDCGNIAASNPIITNIYQYQASPGTGTDAVTTSGGTGSAVVNTVPALITAAVIFNANINIAAGTNFTASAGSFGNNDAEMEYRRVSGAGTYDATATGSANSASWIWMVALAEAVPVVQAYAPFTMGITGPGIANPLTRWR